MVKNEKVYDKIQAIIKSPEYTTEAIDNNNTGLSTIKHLRNHIKELIDIISVLDRDKQNLKKIGSVLITVDKAKDRLLTHVIEDNVEADHHDIMSYDAKNGGTYPIMWTKDAGL
tara:strand:+ start:738 stop:1079 length:342 start_codon:yes stop_codon:yes gene_type:complete